jgi:ABC-2 type transport system ATP-binding protein
MLLGLVEPSSGSANVLGFDVRSSAQQIRERSGALLEHDGLYERLSALDNLEFFARAWHLQRAEREHRARELLQRFGLWERRRDAVNAWSRGMKRKLALARALLHRPSVVFLDEPTAGLDPGAAAALRDDLAALARGEGATIFLNTHNLGEAERICDAVGVISQGKLVAVGRPADLRSQFEGQRVNIAGSAFLPEWQSQLVALNGVEFAQVREHAIELRVATGTSVAPVVRWLVEQGAAIEEVRRGSATLEDVYLQLTGSAS